MSKPMHKVITTTNNEMEAYTNLFDLYSEGTLEGSMKPTMGTISTTPSAVSADFESKEVVREEQGVDVQSDKQA
ncbi:hypothetical protein MRX96_000550 [Rhipicephalus microplus]